MSRLGAAITWLGHAAFHLQPEPHGPGILIDPWLDNPKAPANAMALAEQASLILLTHAHSDHVGDAAGLAAAVDRWNLRWAILPNRYEKLIALLDRSPDWRRLYRDDVGVIYLRQPSAS